MASRYAPFHVIAACKQYDPGVGVIWCDRTKAWYFTYYDKRQPSAITHDDGSIARDLSAGEIREILAQTDERNRKSVTKRDLSRSMDRVMKERVYRQKIAEQKRREELKAAVSDVSDFSRRNRNKVGDAAKPIVNLSNKENQDG